MLYRSFPERETRPERVLRCILFVVLALALIAFVGKKAAHGADANAPPQPDPSQVARVEITPSTQPTEPGMAPLPPEVKVWVPVVPPPKFPDGDRWTPTNVAILAGWGIMAIFTSWLAYELLRQRFGLRSMSERVDRQGAVQNEILKQTGSGTGGSHPPPPPAGGV
jgi:hypothetical protein